MKFRSYEGGGYAERATMHVADEHRREQQHQQPPSLWRLAQLNNGNRRVLNNLYFVRCHSSVAGGANINHGSRARLRSTKGSTNLSRETVSRNPESNATPGAQ